jgi:tetratricopeptide (TPR) repeat protein
MLPVSWSPLWPSPRPATRGQRRLVLSPEFEDEAALLQGVCLLRQDRVQEALSTLHLLKAEGPWKEQILRYQGEAFHRHGQLGEASYMLSQLTSEFPDNVEGHRWLASTYYDLGAQNESVHHLQEVVRLAPEDYRPHWMMGVIFRDFEDFPRSIEHLKRGWELQPPPAVKTQIGIYLARSLRAVHQYEEALSFLGQCEQINEIRILTAMCQFSLTSADEAAALLRETAEPEVESSAIEWFTLRADLSDQQGKPDEVLAILLEAVERFPQEEDLRYRYSLALKGAGREDEAVAQMEIWSTNKELKEQLIALNQQATREPQNAEVRFALEDVCRQLGRENLAVMWHNAGEACRKSNDLLRLSTPPSADPK